MYGFGSSGDGILPFFLLLRQSALEFRTNYSIRVPCVSAKTDILVLQACTVQAHVRRPRNHIVVKPLACAATARARTHARAHARTCARGAGYTGTDARRVELARERY